MSGAAPPPWRRVIISGYGPTLLSSIGYGAAIPLIALLAVHLGGTVGEAALVTALLGIGQLVGDLPAGSLAATFGDKRALTGACLLDAVALASMSVLHTLGMLGVMVFVDGLAGAAFGLARQAFLTDVVPAQYRARALSSLGGVLRLGYVIGPVIGAWIVSHATLSAAFLFAAGMSCAAALVTTLLPDVDSISRTESPGAAPVSAAIDRPVPFAAGQAGEPSDAASKPTMRGVLREHRRVLLTLGTGVSLLMMVRAARQTVIPLWCASHGLSSAQTSLVFALSMAFDVVMFFPGGLAMDRFGRRWVVIPTMLIMGTGLFLLPFTHELTSIALVSALLGLGNGISSGVVMTLGSDASPVVGRPQFLAGWRLFGDAGSSAGPLVISAIASVAPLQFAMLALAALAWLGAAWLARFVPRHPPIRRLA